jgi:hypothetical protein
VDFSSENGRCYAPATEDLWFKFAAGSDRGTVSDAFIKTMITLSFKHFYTTP